MAIWPKYGDMAQIWRYGPNMGFWVILSKIAYFAKIAYIYPRLPKMALFLLNFAFYFAFCAIFALFRVFVDFVGFSPKVAKSVKIAILLCKFAFYFRSWAYIHDFGENGENGLNWWNWPNCAIWPILWVFHVVRRFRAYPRKCEVFAVLKGICLNDDSHLKGIAFK